MKVALYARVSTKGVQGNGREQNVDTQLLALREFVKARGWEVVSECTDVGWSGAKERRPGLDEAMALARARKIDGLVVVAFDRFGRSLAHLVRSLEELQALGVAFVSVRDQFDLSTPLGKLMFGMVSCFAEFERSMIQERVKAGMARVRAQGSRSGKAIGRPTAIFHRDRIPELQAQGLSLRKIGVALGVSDGTVRRELRKNGGAAPSCKSPPSANGAVGSPA